MSLRRSSYIFSSPPPVHRVAKFFPSIVNSREYRGAVASSCHQLSGGHCFASRPLVFPEPAIFESPGPIGQRPHAGRCVRAPKAIQENSRCVPLTCRAVPQSWREIFSGRIQRATAHLWFSAPMNHLSPAGATVCRATHNSCSHTFGDGAHRNRHV